MRTGRISTPTPILAVLSQIMLESVQKLVGQQQVIQKCISSENHTTWESTLIKFWISSFFRFQFQRSKLKTPPGLEFNSLDASIVIPWSSISWSNTHRQVSGKPGSPEKNQLCQLRETKSSAMSLKIDFQQEPGKPNPLNWRCSPQFWTLRCLVFCQQPPMAQKNPLEAAFRVNYMPYQ